MLDEAASPDRGTVQVAGKRPTRAPLVAIGLGLALGVGLGAWYRFLEGVISTGPLPKTISALVVGVGVLGLLGLSAIVLSVSRSTRPLARSALTIAVALVVGLPLGYVVGPTSRPPRDLAGELRLEITGTGPGTYSGAATCRTVENGDGIEWVLARGIGTVGGFPLTVNLFSLGDDGANGSIQLALAGGSDLVGSVVLQELGANRWTGRASFEELTVDDDGPDPAGGWSTASGTVTWTCH